MSLGIESERLECTVVDLELGRSDSRQVVENLSCECDVHVRNCRYWIGNDGRRLKILTQNKTVEHLRGNLPAELLSDLIRKFVMDTAVNAAASGFLRRLGEAREASRHARQCKRPDAECRIVSKGRSQNCRCGGTECRMARCVFGGMMA